MNDHARGVSSQSEIVICYSFGMAGTSEEGRFSRRTDWKLAPNRLTEALLEARAAGREVLDLTLSNPTHAGILYDGDSILKSLADPAALDYDPQPKGMRSAREAVAKYYSCGADTPVREVDPESLVLTTSTSEGYSYIFRLLANPGDEVLVPKPSYPLFDFLADLQDVKLAPYPLIYDHGWQIDLHALEQAITDHSRAIVVVHPNNPTGSYVSGAEREALNAFCGEHKLALIADEVFLDYAHDGTRRLTFASNHDVLTFTLSGLSKISALPQMKVAWIAVCGPEKEVITAMQRLEVIADTYLSMNAPVQLATPVLLDHRKNIQPQLLGRLRSNLEELDRQLARQKICQRLQVEGGWYTVLRVPVTQSDEDLAIDILRKPSVLVHPGHFYDFPADGFLVVSLITPPEIFREGMERVLGMMNG
jgi:alanine-synthesizing transaminase